VPLLRFCAALDGQSTATFTTVLVILAAVKESPIRMTRMLPVFECFHSFQGEGIHMGRSAAFIRLFGCPVQCPWCDSAGTWHPKHVPETVAKVAPEALAEQAARHRPDFVVITGGEPTIHNLHALTDCLRAHRLPVHLETSGAFALQGDFDWVTLSPKRFRPPLGENFKRADEVKLIIDQAQELTRWSKELEGLAPSVPVWLHPEASRCADPSLLKLIASHVRTHGAPYRAGWQLHKLYQVD
jgi:organic radical activating enzyme